MTKQDIIEYVMNTPHNTNKAVLSSMLNQLTDGSSDGDGDTSSDFVKTNITLKITGGDSYAAEFNIMPTDSNENALGCHVYVNDGITYIDNSEISVHVGGFEPSEVVQTVYLYLDGCAYVTCNKIKSANDFTVTGDATIIDNGEDSSVMVSGNCTISVVGDPK